MNRLPRRLLGVLFALHSSMAWSQSTVPGQPSNFEAAVITPSDPTSAEVWLVPEPDGGLRAQNVIAWQLIKNAYYIRNEQLEGGPAWVRSERYDIVARPAKSDLASWKTASPAQAGSVLAQSRLRMQALLRDRFALTLRTEERAKRFCVEAVRVGSEGATCEK
ncbi:MAG: TIGR03435 family protein [Bryobacterales bacterium]|nr:TIGR03435 family protein [Bryobacterales bacterium]